MCINKYQGATLDFLVNQFHLLNLAETASVLGFHFFFLICFLFRCNFNSFKNKKRYLRSLIPKSLGIIVLKHSLGRWFEEGKIPEKLQLKKLGSVHHKFIANCQVYKEVFFNRIKKKLGSLHNKFIANCQVYKKKNF